MVRNHMIVYIVNWLLYSPEHLNDAVLSNFYLSVGELLHFGYLMKCPLLNFAWLFCISPGKSAL